MFLFSRIFLATLIVAAPVSAFADEIGDLEKIVGGGRYMERPVCTGQQSPSTHECCRVVEDDDPLLKTVLAPYKDVRTPAEGHQGLQDCRYRDNGLETRVIMLNPTPRRVAEWTVNACTKAKARSVKQCAEWVWKEILSDSGTQFAATGPIIEDKKSDCWNGPGKTPSFVGYTFRDGVTVRLENIPGVCDIDPKRLKQEPSPYFEARVLRTTNGGPSRVTMLTRQTYKDYFGGHLPSDTPDASGEIEWLRLVRSTYLVAVQSAHHPWLEMIVEKQLPKELRK